MDFDFADVLIEVIERGASDLHLTAGSPPMVRERGQLNGARLPRADAAGHARDRLLDPHQRPAPAARDRLADRPRLLDPRPGALPRQRLLPARLDRRRLPPDPAGHARARGPRPAAGAERLHQEAARLRARHGPDRLGQVHDARRDDRPDQRGAPRAHHDDRGPDRVPPPPPQLHRQPARAGRRRGELRARPEGRAAPGPRRDPRRRDARPRDDRDGADRGRDRPPRVRDPAHPGHRADGRPHRRRVPARSSSTRCASQLSVALQGIVTQQLLPTADGSGAPSHARCSCRRPALRNLIREGKTHQIYSALQTGGAHGMQTMDAALADLVRRHKITRELAEARSSSPEELRRLMGTGAGLA